MIINRVLFFLVSIPQPSVKRRLSDEDKRSSRDEASSRKTEREDSSPREPPVKKTRGQSLFLGALADCLMRHSCGYVHSRTGPVSLWGGGGGGGGLLLTYITLYYILLYIILLITKYDFFLGGGAKIAITKILGGWTPSLVCLWACSILGLFGRPLLPHQIPGQ